MFWDETDLSNFISEYYGRPYRLQQAHMLGQGSYVRCTIPYQGDYEGEEEEFRAWKEADATPPPKPEDDSFDMLGFEHTLRWEREKALFPVEMILNDLHEQGEIPSGEYVIEVNW